MTADDTFLTDAEIERLAGTPRRGRQIAWLAERGYLLDVNLAGRPVVLRAAVEGKARVKPRNRPNFEAIRGDA